MFKNFKALAIVFMSFCLAILPRAVKADSTDMTIDGRAVFEAGQPLISIKLGVNGLVFDTSECANCKSQYPAWRFIGDLKIDSIVQKDWSKVPLTKQSQVDSVSINSAELQDALKDINVYELMKVFPSRIPADTLYWDSIRVKWHKISDLSIYYEIIYAVTTEYDSVLQKLSAVTDIGLIGTKSMPIIDGLSKELVLPSK